MADQLHRVAPEKLRSFAETIVFRLGTSKRDARQIADCLVAADLRGIETHGVARLPLYSRRIVSGAVNPRPKAVKYSSRGAAVAIDGDNGPGPVIGTFAMREAIRRARRYGVGWAGVRNSNHFAHASYYCEAACAVSMIGLASSSGEPSIAPWGGISPFFANNPFALAAPTSTTPVVVDMATSVTARGRIILARQKGTAIPEGWAMDAAGEPTTDPAAALAGSVLPMAGAKGYALIVALEILSGVLTGGAFAPAVHSQQDMKHAAGAGQFFVAIDPTAFMDREEFFQRMDRLMEGVHSAPRRSGVDKILLPGERRQSILTENTAKGIPIHPNILAELSTLADELKIPPRNRL